MCLGRANGYMVGFHGRRARCTNIDVVKQAMYIGRSEDEVEAKQPVVALSSQRQGR